MSGGGSWVVCEEGEVVESGSAKAALSSARAASSSRFS